MTSNAGAQSIVDPKKLGFGVQDDARKDYDRMKNGVMEEVKKIFRPEFLNRIDEIIVFHPLNEKQVEEIVGLMAKKLVGRAKDSLGISLSLTPSVKKQIGKTGFSTKFGARPLRRVIQDKIENPLSDMVLQGTIPKDSRVTVRLEQNEFKFTIADQ